MPISGKQTAITKNIEKIAGQFSADGFAAVFEILKWINENLNLTSDIEFKKECFRKRTADEIVQSKIATGCTDYALVFLALARAAGIAATYVEALDAEWARRPDYENIRGHIFCEVALDDKIYIVDTQGATVRPWIGKRYVVVGRGLDSWDLGVRDIEELKAFINNSLAVDGSVKDE